jgi:hypothetical protein
VGGLELRLAKARRKGKVKKLSPSKRKISAEEKD